MAELQKDLLNLNYSDNFKLSGIEEQVVDLNLSTAKDVDTTILGKVYDDNGKPVARATVKAFDKDGKPYQHTLTEEDGQYLLEGLEEGTYDVRAVKNGYYLTNGKLASLTDGATITLDFNLKTDISNNLGVIAGVVSDTNFQTLGNIKLTLKNSDGTAVAVTTSAKDGEFVFADISDGDYTVIATSQGYLVNTVYVKIIKGTIINTTITMYVDDINNTGTVNGTITDTLKKNAVADAFVGLFAITTSANGRIVEELVAKTKTNNLGRYMFGDVPTGNYIVKAILTKTKTDSQPE